MFNKVFLLIKLVFSKSSAASTAAEHSRERYRRAGRTAFTAMVASTVNIATGLITVPITLSYLGVERYGLWMALTSFVALLTFSDMGLTIGLQNALAECNGRDDRKNPVSYISSAFFVMGLVFVILTALALFILPQIPFEHLIKVNSEIARGELLPTAQTMLIIFGFGLLAGLIQPIYNAYQQGYWANLWLVIGRVAGFFAVLLCIWLKLGLPILVGCFMGLPFVAMGCGMFFLFKRMPWLKPSFGSISRKAMRRIFNTGMKAAIAQVAGTLINGGPALIIANQLGASAVTPFAVAQKLLATSNIILATALSSLWPAYGEAAARGDWAWIKKTFRRSVKLGFAIQIPIFILFSFVGQFIIQVWAGKGAVPGWSLLMAVNVWFLILIWYRCDAVLLNGLDHMIGQAIYVPFFAFCGLAIGYWLARFYGDIGVVWPVACVSIGGGAICAEIERYYVLDYKKQKVVI